jgi:hypothetical protein
MRLTMDPGDGDRCRDGATVAVQDAVPFSNPPRYAVLGLAAPPKAIR